MKNLIYIFALVLTVSSCSEFQKALKSEDIKTKFALGTELYDAQKWNKANRLFAQIVPNYRGKPQAQKLMYMYAKSFYMMEDYYISAYKLEQFAKLYPTSEKVEEAAFLSAKSYYNLSPVFSKEQKETNEAVEKLQLFINKYPESEYLSEANTMVKELDYKLEKKAFEIAKQYNTTARVSVDHIACITSVDNFLLNYPGTTLRKEALFWKFDSAYKLAINSVERRKEERLNNAITYFKAFKKSYTDSELFEEANRMNVELQEALKKYNTKS